MSRQPHPATEPVILALRALAEWRPTDAGELARILDQVHNPGGQSIISSLDNALGALGAAALELGDLTPEQSQAVNGHLEAAAKIIIAAAGHWIDRAREATGAEPVR